MSILTEDKLIIRAKERADKEITLLAAFTTRPDLVERSFELLFREAYLDGAKDALTRHTAVLPVTEAV